LVRPQQRRCRLHFGKPMRQFADVFLVFLPVMG
jgi:hypothetical protein